MNEANQTNPYETPKSPNARLRFNYLIYGSMIAVVLVVATAATLMLTVSRKSTPKQEIFMRRGPVDHRQVEPPSEVKE